MTAVNGHALSACLAGRMSRLRRDRAVPRLVSDIRNYRRGSCADPPAGQNAGGFARSRRRDDRGDAMVIWCLGLAVLLLPLGGMSVDLWHAISQERALQTAAASAADAGASGVDIPIYRQTGRVVLDPTIATNMAETNLAEQTTLPPLSGPPDITVAAGGNQITVTLRENVHLTLLGILEGDHPIRIAATATSTPRPSGAP